MDKNPIRDFYGRILGWVEEDPKGNKIVRDFYGRIVSKYDKAYNVTRDFYGRIVSKGDTSTSFLFDKK